MEWKIYNAINLIGFLGFEFVFSNDKIYFKDQPPYRYWGWFNMEKIVRDEWRKYLFQILNLFGGNRVIYLPDNMSDAKNNKMILILLILHLKK